MTLETEDRSLFVNFKVMKYDCYAGVMPMAYAILRATVSTGVHDVGDFQVNRAFLRNRSSSLRVRLGARSPDGDHCSAGHTDYRGAEIGFIQHWDGANDARRVECPSRIDCND